MRIIIALFVVAAALVGETQLSNAQSPYSYPWCAVTGGKDAGCCPAITRVGSSAEQHSPALAETVSRVPITTLNRHSFRTVRW